MRATLESLLQDAKYGLRMFVRSPGATAVSVLALAMGIGIHTAAFTAYKAMVLRPVDAVRPGEMRNVAVVRESGAAEYLFSHADFETLRTYTRGGFSDMIAWHPERVTLSAPGSSEPASGGLFTPGTTSAEFVQVFVVSPNYFEVLGVARSFAGDNSVIVGEDFWTRRFGRDPGIAGRSILLNDIPVVISAVAPRGFAGTGMSEPAFWVSTALDPRLEGQPQLLVNREMARYRIFGRLAAFEGAVQAQLNTAIEHLRTLHKPGTPAAESKGTALVWAASPFPLPLDRYPGVGLVVLLILSAASMVLAVACANAGSLQLARVRSRHKELTTRAWLGATRPRMMRQFATEYAMLGLVSGVAAHGMAYAALKILVWWSGRLLPVGYGALIFDVSPDATVLLYVMAISLAGGLLTGIAPSWLAGRTGGAATRDGRRAQNVLVAVQVALSVVLLATAGMLVRSSVQAMRVDPGYAAANLMAVEVEFQKSAGVPLERQQALFQRVRTGIEALPGVQRVVASPPPLAFRQGAIRTTAEAAGLPVRFGAVADGYFDLTGIPVLYGRAPETAIPEGAVLNETAVRRLWPEDPVPAALGRAVLLSGEGGRGRTVTVVGVARNTANLHIGSSDPLEAYVPVRAVDAARSRTLLVRTYPAASQLLQSVTSVVRSSGMQAEGLMTVAMPLEDSIRGSSKVVLSGIAAAVSSSVGILGLILALMGIAGTVGYIVALRTREVGIRMAIGAQRFQIVSLILREGARPVLVGLLAGGLGAAGALYAVSRFVFGTGGVDLASLGGVAVLFVAMACGASLAPVRRALRIDPAVALRQEP